MGYIPYDVNLKNHDKYDMEKQRIKKIKILLDARLSTTVLYIYSVLKA